MWKIITKVWHLIRKTIKKVFYSHVGKTETIRQRVIFKKIRKVWSWLKFTFRNMKILNDKFILVKIPDGYVIHPRDKSLIIVDEIYKMNIYDGIKEITKDDTIIDIGAHVGIYSIKAARKGKVVIAVEAAPPNYKILKKNIELNRIQNIKLIHIALSDFNGETKFYITHEDSGMHSMLIPEGKYSVINVKAKKLDNLVSELKLKRVDFIKIDTEGAELPILKGGIETIRKFNPYLIIASYHYSDELRNVSDFLEEIGYNKNVIKNKIIHASK